MSNTYEYDADLYHKGKYYMIEAELEDHGSYVVEKDGSGQEFFEIENDPVFYNLMVDGVATSDKELRKAAEALLTELYWQEELLW